MHTSDPSLETYPSDLAATLKGVLDSSLNGIVACTAIREADGTIVDFRFTLANPMSERMLHHTIPEIVGDTLLTLFPGNRPSGLFDTYVQVTETGVPCTVQTHYTDSRLDFWLDVSAVKLGDGVVITFTDVSEQMRRTVALQAANADLAAANEALQAQAEELQAQAEELQAQADALQAQTEALSLSNEHLRERSKALALSERKLQGVFNQSFGFIGVLDPDGLLLDVNETALALIDQAPAQVLGRPFWETPWWSGDAAVQAQIREAVARAGAGEVYHHELPFIVQGQARRVDFTLVPLKDETGRVVMLIPQGRDVTSEREAEAEVSKLQSERIAVLEHGDRLKDQFLSILSHELRTPINAIMGFGSVLDDGIAGELSPRQRDYTGKILDSADALLTLIDDLLVMSRVQAGQFSIKAEPMDVAGVAANALETLGTGAAKKGIVLENALGDALPRVMGDPMRVGQVLNNLITNAIKFTPAGGTVSVRARVTAEGVRYEVTDTGIGIALADQSRLFKRFGQIDTSHTRVNTGTGLGLSIVKAIVEALGGEVGLESEAGCGATFWFTLRRAS